MNDKMLKFDEICTIYDIEPSFVREIHDFGLIDFIEEDETLWLPSEMLDDFERILRLNSELGVNLEGIDIIMHLLERIENLENEITELKRQLKFFEGNYLADNE